MVLGSASVGGSFYAYGDALAKVLSETLNTSVENSPSGGSVANTRLLHNDEIDLGLLQSRFAGMARQSTNMFEDEEPYTDLRIIASIFTFTNVTYVLKESGITKFTDLKGKKIGLGPDPEVFDESARPSFEAHGFDYDNDIERIYASKDAIYRLFGDGSIDAVSEDLGGLQADPALLQIASTKDVLILGYDKELMEKAGVPVAMIPKGSVVGAEADTWAYKMGAVVFATTTRMSDDVVYLITKALHENLETIAQLTPEALEGVANPAILARDLQIVYHLGAVRYWEEVGLWGI
jgi:hypothetical protein